MRKEITITGTGNLNAILTSADLIINVVRATKIELDIDSRTGYQIDLTKGENVRYFGKEYTIEYQN